MRKGIRRIQRCIRKSSVIWIRASVMCSIMQIEKIIVADRFPFLYFVKEYGLTYYAAFPGCAKDTEADPKTIAFLIDKVKADQIPVIFHIELSNQQMRRSIAEATGAKERQLNSIHNVTQKDFDAGVTYVDLMRQNVKTLKEALN